MEFLILICRPEVLSQLGGGGGWGGKGFLISRPDRY